MEKLVKSSKFKSLGISPQLCSVVERLGLEEPTQIQAGTIPLALSGRNIVASAETGSGKTAAFLLPIIDGMEDGRTTPALVLAPTRELAMQIEANARSFGESRVRTVSAVGGESLPRQISALKKDVDILIATPGRLNDLIERRAVRLGRFKVLVLDEADRMLDMGFLPQVRRIIRHLPEARQTMLLTATLSNAVERFAAELMPEWALVDVSKPSTVATLSQKAFPVMSHAKLPLLLALLREHGRDTFLVFVRTRRGADRLSEVLQGNRHLVATLHSDLNQSQRNRALAGFKSGKVRVLVATDVAARGIDVDEITFVVNYEVPPTAEDYIHRVGRTARAGRDGSALTFVSPEEEGLLASIERSTGVKVERSRLRGFSDGRSEEQVRLASELGLLRTSSTRSFRRRRAS